jgi:hypothetical protein
MKSYIFWDITPCIPLKINGLFEGHVAPIFSNCAWHLLHTGFLLGFFFNLEDGGNIFLRNVGWLFNGLLDVISQKKEVLKLRYVAHYQTQKKFRAFCGSPKVHYSDDKSHNWSISSVRLKQSIPPSCFSQINFTRPTRKADNLTAICEPTV